MIKYKQGRRPYSGETWKILAFVDGCWVVHSEYSHYSFMKDALKELRVCNQLEKLK